MSREWWHGAVLYQVYPRSFQDTDGDGVGDLEGIRQRLDHIADLGVDGLWISPILRSPMRDFGYDVSDFRAVDPLFGSNDDLDRLIEEAHARGLKVLNRAGITGGSEVSMDGAHGTRQQSEPVYT